MDEIVGYCTIKKDAKCDWAMGKPEDWRGQDCRVFEFNSEGDVLAVHQNGAMMAMIAAKDIYRSFKCSVFNDVICAPGLNVLQKMDYSFKAVSRKGGYPPLIKQMVIQASLAKGHFYDHFLWELQDDNTKKAHYG